MTKVWRPGELKLQASVLTIGAFDGLHRGHQALIREAVRRALFHGVPSVVWTFDPPPRAFFQGAQILTPLPEKIRRLSAMQVQHVVVAPFDEDYAKLTAREFLAQLATVAPLEIWVGYNFRFGCDRTGCVRMLARYFDVHVMGPVCCERGEPISSSRIRCLLEKGQTAEARRILGWRDPPELRPRLVA